MKTYKQYTLYMLWPTLWPTAILHSQTTFRNHFLRTDLSDIARAYLSPPQYPLLHPLAHPQNRHSPVQTQSSLTSAHHSSALTQSPALTNDFCAQKCKRKCERKVHPRTGHEGPEGE